jgi:lipoprotein Spr
MNAEIDTGNHLGDHLSLQHEPGIPSRHRSWHLASRFVRIVCASGMVLGWVGSWVTGSFAQEVPTERPAKSSDRLSDQMKRVFSRATTTSFAGAGAALLPGTALPEERVRQWTSMVLPRLRIELPIPPQLFLHQTTAQLYHEITKRLGVRYRFRGTDDSGYDCSGFVWRVFQSAGGEFDRVAARTLWTQLPEANGEEREQFGTLVFFNGLKHVGIVRDANTFYHASRTQGVTLSSYDGYWGRRVTGFRRAPAIAP